MTRLQAELHRLYDLDATGSAAVRQTDSGTLARTMVLELRKPADWRALSKVWQGVQAELHLPAPAIAVNGVDGYQLWFSLAEALPIEQAQAFIQALCARYLSDVAPERLNVWPASGQLTPPAPPWERAADQWSAFVAPDLAPVFSEAPWLDVPPSADGQADLLSQLKSIQLPDLRSAIAQTQAASTGLADKGMLAERPATAPGSDPKRFLIDVMNNEAVALPLRIDAAKALLPYFETQR